MKLVKKIGIIFIPLLVGIISSLFVDNNLYEKINLPSFAPPSIVFPIVWTILYILMGFSLYLIIRDGSTKQNKFLFALQLFLNFLWVLIFFRFELFLPAFVIIIIMDVLCFYTIITYFKYNKVSAYLLIPYLVWICFASLLNWMIYIIN